MLKAKLGILAGHVEDIQSWVLFVVLARQVGAWSLLEHEEVSDGDERQEVTVLIGLIVMELHFAAESNVALK